MQYSNLAPGKFDLLEGHQLDVPCSIFDKEDVVQLFGKSWQRKATKCIVKKARYTRGSNEPGSTWSSRRCYRNARMSNLGLFWPDTKKSHWPIFNTVLSLCESSQETHLGLQSRPKIQELLRSMKGKRSVDGPPKQLRTRKLIGGSPKWSLTAKKRTSQTAPESWSCHWLRWRQWHWWGGWGLTAQLWCKWLETGGWTKSRRHIFHWHWVYPPLFARLRPPTGLFSSVYTWVLVYSLFYMDQQKGRNGWWG